MPLLIASRMPARQIEQMTQLAVSAYAVGSVVMWAFVLWLATRRSTGMAKDLFGL
jgi:hypothetical protein